VKLDLSSGVALAPSVRGQLEALIFDENGRLWCRRISLWLDDFLKREEAP
jgi:hypothetical protein